MPAYRYFDASKLEPGDSLPLGVPARDLTEEDYNEFPEHVRTSIDAWAAFRKTKPKATPAEPTDEPPVDETAEQEA